VVAVCQSGCSPACIGAPGFVRATSQSGSDRLALNTCSHGARVLPTTMPGAHGEAQSQGPMVRHWQQLCAAGISQTACCAAIFDAIDCMMSTHHAGVVSREPWHNCHWLLTPVGAGL
jgi:hypothetical protein